MSLIDYNALALAQNLYEDLGYQIIEVPWRVSTEIVNITCPPGAVPYQVAGTDKSLIGSGEQGFMGLMNKGILPPGKYQTITPCFRNESYDTTHSKQFMKLELIEVLPGKLDWQPSEYCARMIQHAHAVMSKVSDEQLMLQIQPMITQDPLAIARQHDIGIAVGQHPSKWIELGSYGVRRAFFGTWVFGTGLAEPRFSNCVSNVRFDQNRS